MNKTAGKGALAKNFTGIGRVTREMVQVRTRKLALSAGRVPPHVSQADYEQAKRELKDESELERRKAVPGPVREAKRGNSVPGLTGGQVPEFPGEDEDDEGRNESAQLVERGVKEAGREQRLQAARAAGGTGQRAP